MTDSARMSHAQALAAMVAVTLMWSIAGVVTRWLETDNGLSMTFWRSSFNAVALGLMLLVLRGPRRLAAILREGGSALWLSGACWAVMFTAFMVALTLTDVANVLITLAMAPLFTALIARTVLGVRQPTRTWVAIAVAGVGIVGMFISDLSVGEHEHVLGMGVALAVPLAAAINWSTIQHTTGRPTGAKSDLMPAVLIGAVLSAVLVLPWAQPLQVSASDVAWLGLLGVVQLAIPCLLAVSAARVLSAPEVSLIALLEVVFGVAWAWLLTTEAPRVEVLIGGGLVLGALVFNESLALRARQRAAVLSGQRKGVV